MVDVVRARGGLLFYFTRLLLCLSTPDIASSLLFISGVSRLSLSLSLSSLRSAVRGRTGGAPGRSPQDAAARGTGGGGGELALAPLQRPGARASRDSRQLTGASTDD